MNNTPLHRDRAPLIVLCIGIGHLVGLCTVVLSYAQLK